MRVLMLGPRLDVRGGITSLTQTFMAAPALRDVVIDHVGTVGEGSRGDKVLQMASGQARFLRAITRKPDVVHIHVANWISLTRKGWYAEQARALGIPVILHVNGSEIASVHDGSRAGSALVRHVLERATLVLAVSERARRQFDAWTRGRATTEVLYNPVDLEALGRGQPRTHPPTVLFMGVIGARKGPFDLVEVVGQVVEAVPGTRFLFGGNGEVPRLKEAVARLGIEAHVEVLGWIAGADKRKAFERAAIYCLPSYNEALPVSVLEAMTAGLPVVSTTIAGTPEAVTEGETGWLVEPGDRKALADRLIRLARDPDLRERMGRAGRTNVVARFATDGLAERLLGFWRRVAKGSW